MKPLLAFAALLLSQSIPASAAQPCTPAPPSCADKPDMTCGNVDEKDIINAFEIVVKRLDLDAKLDDQKPWGKPPRKDTLRVLKSDDKLFNLVGSPAAAFSANTAQNKPDQVGDLAAHHWIFLHGPTLSDISQNRNELLALLMHEGEHLKNHHPEKVEKHNLDSFEDWCKKNAEQCENGDSKTTVAAWDRETGKERAAFQASLEHEADAKAQEVLTQGFEDPKAAKSDRDPQAMQEALASAEQWLKARCEKLEDPTHGTIRERIAQLQKDAAHRKSFGAGAARAGKVEAGASGF